MILWLWAMRLVKTATMGTEWYVGGDGWWAIILFAMIFGWGNGGWGGFGGNGGINSPAGQGCIDTCGSVQ